MAAHGRTGEAEKFYREAAEAGDESAAWNLAIILYKRGDSHWERWCQIAAEGGDVKAAGQLGVELCQRGDLIEGVRWLKAAAAAGDENAIYNLNLLDQTYLG